jgi:hypothetical protein
MTVAQLEKRVEALEKTVEELRGMVVNGGQQRHWWREDAGRFANDPVFDEIVRLGREYRDSLPADRPKKNRNKKRTNVGS